MVAQAEAGDEEGRVLVGIEVGDQGPRFVGRAILAVNVDLRAVVRGNLDGQAAVARPLDGRQFRKGDALDRERKPRIAAITLAIGWSDEFSIGGGFKIGATVGFLVWFGVDFIQYGWTNLSNLTATIVDPLLEIIRSGFVGAVIGGVLGKMKEN